MQQRKPNFSDFLVYFPEIELPITLTDESIHAFSQQNKILPERFTIEFLNDHFQNRDAEFREVIPCFKIPETHEMHAIVCWEGGLLTYEYHLMTFNKKGQFINGKTIAGTISDGNKITQSVATIDPDWMIYIVAGETHSEQKAYSAEQSRAFTMELLANGEIIFSLDD